jgi:hypothetical protein
MRSIGRNPRAVKDRVNQWSERKQSDIDASPKGERFGSESMRRADRDFRHRPEASEDFLVFPSSLFLSQPANPTSFATPFSAANNQLQPPSAEDDLLSSAGSDQIAAELKRRRWNEAALRTRPKGIQQRWR